MKYLWEDIADIQESLSAYDKIILLLDFDGTLVPIPPHRKQANLTHALKKLLLLIKNNPNLYLGIVSGRKLNNIKSKIGISNIIFVGSHGWEWEIVGQKGSIQLNEAKRKIFNEAREKMEKLVRQFAGTSIEEKYCSFSIHYRFADDPKSFQHSFAKLVEADNQLGLMRIMKGKKVYDILPNHNWRKGHAVSLIIKRMTELNRKKRLLYIYIGDDTTDERVFSMHSKILTIRVGKNCLSKAKYYVKNTKEVHELLKLLRDYHPEAKSIA